MSPPILFFHPNILEFCFFNILHLKMCFPHSSHGLQTATGHYTYLHVSNQHRSFSTFCSFTDFSSFFGGYFDKLCFGRECLWSYARVVPRIFISISKPPVHPVPPESRISVKQRSIPWYSLFNNRFSFYWPPPQLWLYSHGNRRALKVQYCPLQVQSAELARYLIAGHMSWTFLDICRCWPVISYAFICMYAYHTHIIVHP